LAESWQKEGFQAHCIIYGQIFMRSKILDALFIEKLRGKGAKRPERPHVSFLELLVRLMSVGLIIIRG
jgi:hypothetical protein